MRSRSTFFVVVGIALLAYGLWALESIAGSFGDLLRGQVEDRALILVLAGVIAILWGSVRSRWAPPK